MTTSTQKLVNTSTWFAAVAATLLLAAYAPASNAEAWELRTTPNTVPGTVEIESGEIDKAIRISNVWLPHVDRRKKVAVLTNLCIGYILSNDLDQAEEYCERAVERSNYEAVSYNNRGVLKALQADYEGAAQDFATAKGADCFRDCPEASDAPMNKNLPRAVALRNFDRAEYQVKAAEMREDDQIAARTN